MGKIAVIGAGSWGTALATVLASNGHQIYLYARNRERVEEINTKRTNQRYLPGISLPPGITATSEMAVAIQDAEAVFLVVPSQSVRSVSRDVAPYLHPDALLVHAVKGFELSSRKRISTVLREELGETKAIAVLSGPSHAEEVARRLPTTVVVASDDVHVAEKAQDLLINTSFRVYVNLDPIGVEVSGALKNVIAIAAGLSDGLAFGDNAKAALITRGLAEITRLGVAMGASQATFSGLAGVGDLVVTCTSRLSRNWRAGFLLAQGKSLQQVLDELGMVAEGVKTTQVAYQLARHYNIDMPITSQLHQVLFAARSPREAVESLMSRLRRHEIELLDEITPFRRIT
ncbi:MAG: glycerol-3-phosphate dehydrogenase [Bacillus thermozeamaize]|jgi:glycerol-3-phosphate dehydrogenase (NAD(P)+)|uniref:Glycerol-3-phosphate dehydrogenase [NAD(P)+] n=1 Tax=Bacillus thermozeamaize TaxID=230954 RepID=A0A1Y3PRR7_9BACI|nr:MAG: glycerol-3-phosphate dehydrogenase [Bacillus thermozeamaize]